MESTCGSTFGVRKLLRGLCQAFDAALHMLTGHVADNGIVWLQLPVTHQAVKSTPPQ